MCSDVSKALSEGHKRRRLGRTPWRLPCACQAARSHRAPLPAREGMTRPSMRATRALARRGAAPTARASRIAACFAFGAALACAAHVEPRPGAPLVPGDAEGGVAAVAEAQRRAHAAHHAAAGPEPAGAVTRYVSRLPLARRRMHGSATVGRAGGRTEGWGGVLLRPSMRRRAVTSPRRQTLASPSLINQDVKIKENLLFSGCACGTRAARRSSSDMPQRPRELTQDPVARTSQG